MCYWLTTVRLCTECFAEVEIVDDRTNCANRKTKWAGSCGSPGIVVDYVREVAALCDRHGGKEGDADGNASTNVGVDTGTSVADFD